MVSYQLLPLAEIAAFFSKPLQDSWCLLGAALLSKKMHLFVSDLKKASELLSTTTQELEKGALPQTLQGAEQQVERHQRLMQEVLSNAQLVSLQREGGATLARLRKEAARLSISPDVRHSIDGTLALYNLVEEEVHTLVTKSNSRLEHLQFLLKVRELQAEFSKLGLWLEEEGGSQLSEVGPAESSLESTGESYRRFKEFFKEATVHYNRGLSLSKEAAKVHGSKFPEMGAFEEAKRAFQAKLTVFYMDMEMKGAELETLLDLYRFRDKVAQIHLACKQRLTLWGPGEEEPRSTQLLQDLQNSLQVLSEEFSAERFQQMKAQASSLRHKRGLAVWGEALEACQQAKRILEETLAKYKEARGREAPDCVESGGSSGPDPGPACSAPKEGLCFDGALAKTAEEGGGSVGGGGFSVVPSREKPLCSTGQAAKGGGEVCPASLEAGAPETQSLSKEAPEHLHSPPQGAPPAHASSPRASPGPRTRESPGCASLPARGHRSRKKEPAQYFQLSRQGSFSSEDTDSQTSTEDSLSGCATLPMDSPGPQPAWSPDKSRGIVYLENHSTSRAAAAAATAPSDQ